MMEISKHKLLLAAEYLDRCSKLQLPETEAQIQHLKDLSAFFREAGIGKQIADTPRGTEEEMFLEALQNSLRARDHVERCHPGLHYLLGMLWNVNTNLMALASRMGWKVPG